MAEITAITPQVKDKSRCNIEVDGRFFCGLKIETAMAHRLKKGVCVTEEQLSLLQLESEKMTALDKALCYISGAMKTEKEIRLYLAKKGYLKDICDYVVEKMRSYGYLDDGAYSASYVESVQNKKGRRLIAMELKRKGVCDEEIEGALQKIENEGDTALKILQKYLAKKEKDVKNLQKGYAYLISKGFDYDTAREALQRLKDVEEDIHED